MLKIIGGNKKSETAHSDSETDENKFKTNAMDWNTTNDKSTPVKTSINDQLNDGKAYF